MALFDFLKQKQAKPNKGDERWLQQFLSRIGGRVTFEDAKDERYIEDGYQLNPTVYSIVSQISKTASQVPWKVFKKNPDGTLEPVVMPLIQSLLDKPNYLHTFPQLVQQSLGFKLLTGNTFLWGINPDENSLNTGKPVAIWALPSQYVQIHQEGPMEGIAFYSLDLWGSEAPIPAGEVLHIADFNPDYQQDASFLYGQSPLRAAIRSLDTNNDTVTSAASYVRNQGPQMILSATNDGVAFDETQAKALKAKFRRNNQGPENAGDVLITPAQFDVTNLGMTASDVQLLETRDFTKLDICNVYNFPALLIGLQEGTYENQKEAKKALWEDVIIPHLNELRDGLNMSFISKFGEEYVIDFDVSDIKSLQEDKEMQAATYALYVESGVCTINEIREMLGKDPIDGDEYNTPQRGKRFTDGTKDDTSGPEEVRQEDS